jgi:hypothetical protein
MLSTLRNGANNRLATVFMCTRATRPPCPCHGTRAMQRRAPSPHCAPCPAIAIAPRSLLPRSRHAPLTTALPLFVAPSLLDEPAPCLSSVPCAPRVSPRTRADLNNVSSGGETGFPRAVGAREWDQADTLDCAAGMAVRPSKDKVVIFYSMLPNGELDYASQHIGCNVLEGEKWAANFWIWAQDSPMNRGGDDARHFQEAIESKITSC